MRLIFAFMVVLASLVAGPSFAENTWQKPALSDCGPNAKVANRQCFEANFCLDATTDACLAHVGKTTEDQGRSPLLAQCFDRKMRQCLLAVMQSDTAPTNVTKSPDGWDCINSDGGKSDLTYCRRTNYCLDTAGMVCSNKVGAEKYTLKGQEALVTCIKETEMACMRRIN